jgi:hypothetical protein
LALWINKGTQWFRVNHRKPRELGVASANLEETFASLREYQWKLNPNKCIFGVPPGKLLGFIISHRGIEANP